MEVRLDVLVIATATAVPTRLGAARVLTVLPLGLEGWYRELGATDAEPDNERGVTVAAQYGGALTGPSCAAAAGAV